MRCPEKPRYSSGKLRAKLAEEEERALVEIFGVIEQRELSYSQAAFILDAVKEELCTAWIEERAAIEPL